MHEFTPVFSLSFHGGYGCRHRGACCTAGWPIPVEPDQAEALALAHRTHALRLIPDAASLFSAASDCASWPVLGIADGNCVCYDATAAPEQGRCRIHRALGHSALPQACRQFPRVCVQDPRGVFVTLSHYCPTAAEMLERAECPAAIVESAPGFPRGAEYEGLDARASLPPLLRPGMLIDWESWSVWERLSVQCLTREAQSSSVSLTRLRTAVEHARTWSPGAVPLAAHFSDAFERAESVPGMVAREPDRRLAEVLSAIPETLCERFARPRLTTRSAAIPSDVVARHFLAAHAFANWTAHLGMGLRTWLRSIETAHALVSLGLGVDGADLLLRHLADPAALARVWSAAETG